LAIRLLIGECRLPISAALNQESEFNIHQPINNHRSLNQQ
jgi:hypothetical protein